MKHSPISSKCNHFLHGADYNPDQWKQTPHIWDEDMRLMKLAHCNAMSVGIFSWTSLEPEEGRFNFEWLDTIMEKLAENKVYAILATPSGARPAWMSQKYPEVLRVRANGIRNLHGVRHNHCYSSPVYREKVGIINEKLAQRYQDHPALLMWHVSNEYGGECFCEMCREAFRNWLKQRYQNDLDKLNHAWWTAFWSHTYTDWSQIEPPAPHGETSVHGQNLDWRRFVTFQTLDFYKHEIKPLKRITPDIPVTTNFMGLYPGLDYWAFAPYVDVVSWDNYPCWHGEEEDWKLAARIAFAHDINRSLKGGKPFMLLESTPSMTNWQPVAKLKRPGMHLLSSIQAVAHGSDTVQYFQWRKSRGAYEKFHGAVVDHCGHENTRVFKDVAQVGSVLKKLDNVIGTTVEPDVAIIYDWENRWAIEDAAGPRIEKKNYPEVCQRHYQAFWSRGVPVDVINMECDFSKYKLLVAPMLYMIKPKAAQRIEDFVKSGGTLVTTYWSGIVDENDLCFLGGFPGPIRNVTGVWSEEIDALYDNEANSIVIGANDMGLSGEYRAEIFCDLVHQETAKVLATYKKDFYAGRPALTVNAFGNGKAYYIASRNEQRFIQDFYNALIDQMNIKKALDVQLPEGVTAQMRSDGEKDTIFIMNFSPKDRTVELGAKKYKDIVNDKELSGSMTLKPFGISILEA